MKVNRLVALVCLCLSHLFGFPSCSSPLSIVRLSKNLRRFFLLVAAATSSCVDISALSPPSWSLVELPQAASCHSKLEQEALPILSSFSAPVCFPQGRAKLVLHLSPVSYEKLPVPRYPCPYGQFHHTAIRSPIPLLVLVHVRDEFESLFLSSLAASAVPSSTQRGVAHLFLSTRLIFVELSN